MGKDNTIKNSKLIETLKLLNSQELNEAKQFLKARYHNPQKKVEDLFKLLIKDHSQFENSTLLDRNFLCERLFGQPNENNEANLRQLMSSLNAALEQFLIEQEIKNHKDVREEMLRKVYHSRNNHKRYEAGLNNMIKGLEKQIDKSKFIHFQLFQLTYELLSIPQINRIERSKGYRTLFRLIDDQFCFWKLTLACEQLNREAIAKTEPQVIPFLEEVVTFVEKNEIGNHPTVVCALKILRLFKGEIKFNDAEVTFESLFEKLPPDDRANFLVLLINYTAHQIRLGNTHYSQASFKLYKKGIDHKLIMTQKGINMLTYLNIIASGTESGEYNWVKKFLEEKLSLIPSNQQRMAKIMAEATYTYYLKKGKENYRKCLLLLRKVKSKNVFLRLRNYSLTLRSTFELYTLNELESSKVENAVNRFKYFLSKQDQMSEEIIHPYREACNQIIILLKIFESKAIFSRKELLEEVKRFKQKLGTGKHLAFRPWLLEKAEGLLTKPSGV